MPRFPTSIFTAMALAVVTVTLHGHGTAADSHCLMQAMDANAKKVVQACEKQFEAHMTDCNKFLRATAEALKIHDFKEGQKADEMIDFLETVPAGWTKLDQGKHAEAHTKAKAGFFVVAGMKSSDMKKTDGHVTVVTAGDLVTSAMDKTDYPRGYWGEKNGVGQQCGGMNFSFPPERKTKLRYYWRSLP